MFIPRSSPSAFFRVYCFSHSLSLFFFPFLSSPQGLDKYSFFPFLVSDEDSLHLSLAPFIFSCFAVFIYHAAHLSRFLPLSSSLRVLPPLCFPFLILSSQITCPLSLPLSSAALSPFVCLPRRPPSPICMLLFLPSPTSSVPLYLFREQRGVYSPPGCVRCHGEACLVAAGGLSNTVDSLMHQAHTMHLPVACGHANSKKLT